MSSRYLSMETVRFGSLYGSFCRKKVEIVRPKCNISFCVRVLLLSPGIREKDPLSSPH